MRTFDEEREIPSAGVVAERAGQTFVVLPPREEACLDVVLEQDLDGDGWTDALIEIALACGGNASPHFYVFVAGTSGERFEVQDLAYQWGGIDTLENWNGRPSLVLETNNEGWNLHRPEMVTRRYVFEQRRAVLVEEKHAVELRALANLRAEQFQGAAHDAERILRFDLDGDGKQDQLVGTLWERWGRIFWHVRFATGHATAQSGMACKRIGVLADKTLGHHDIVCDFDERFRWNGKAYVAEAE